MKASELVAAVTTTVQDLSYTSSAILAILNRGQLKVASGADRPHGEALLAPLPDLFTSANVTVTGASATVSMPVTFHRGLTRVSYGDEPLTRYDSLIKFIDDYEGETGSTPEAYCLKGNTLWIAPIKSTNSTVKAYFHRLPVDMAIATGPPAVDTSPDGIPAHLHFDILYNFACREIFNDIEQDIDGRKPNRDRHDAAYRLALTDLERYIGPEDGLATNVADEYYTNI